MSSNWTSSLPTFTTVYAFPAVNVTKTDTAAILAEQVTKILTAGAQMVTNTTALTTPSAYYIVNYWSEALVTKHGIIKGAVRIETIKTGTLETSGSITAGNLNNLDASKTVLVYCFTGQTSSFIAAWLTVMGYDAKLIPYGMNGLKHTKMAAPTATANTWGVGADISRDLQLVAN